MIKPEFRTTKFRKLCCCINNFLETWYIKYLLGPVLFVIPVVSLNTIISERDLLLQLSYAQKTIEYQIPLIIILTSLILLSKISNPIIREYSKPNSHISQEELLIILDTLNTAVSSKTERFLNVTKKVLANKWKPARIFQEITKPEQQIALLIFAIQGIFEFLFKREVEIRVGLMEIENNKPTEWFTFAPKETPPKTGPNALSAPTSAIMRSLELGDIVVVEDMQNEINKNNKDGRMCIKGSTNNNDNGSLITLPIYCPNTREPIYVLSVKSNKVKCFLQEEKERYKWIFQNIFFTRIILEHHLLLMKKEAFNK